MKKLASQHVPGWFVLTDGISVDFTEPKFFSSLEEYDQAQSHATQATDGNMHWTPQYPQVNK